MADSDYDSTPNQIPPFPISLLSSLLSYLIPAPNPPLPPDLISTALLHRHQFLPPSLDDPLAHFVHSKGVAEQREEVSEALDGVSRLMGEGDHPSLTPEYNLPDPHTLQARILLYSSLASSPPPSLALLFLYEGTTNGWRYHDLRILSSSESSSPSSSDVWTSNLEESLSSAEERRRQVEQSEREKEAAVAALSSSSSSEQRENVEGDGVVASSDDFWSGFSDEEEEGGEEAGGDPSSATHPPSIPSPNEPQTPPLHHSDSHETPSSIPSSPSKPSYLNSAHSSSASLDDYWGRYGGAEDGIAPSAPPSPGVSLHHPTSNSNHHSSYQSYGEQEEPRQVWGTGGETPISWTPNPQDQSKDDQASYFLRSDAEDIDDEQGSRGFYASGGAGGDAAGGRPRGRTVTADDVLAEEGTYPVFPAPPFKGLTPAGSLDVPLMMGGFSMRQKMMDEEKEEQRRREADGAETDATRSDESTPSPPHSTKSALPPFSKSTTRLNTPPKVTNGFNPLPLPPFTSSKRSVAQSHLKSALSSLLKMHQLATGLEGGEAAKEFLEVAMGV